VSRIQFQAVSGVYALIDPRSGRVMYVGQSIDIDFRYRQHCDPFVTTSDCNLRKRHWIDELRKSDLTPTLVILERCEYPDSDEIERHYIRDFRAQGQCEFNIADGGRNCRAVGVNQGHRDDWFQLGLKIKRADALLWEIAQDLCRLSGARLADRMINLMTKLRRIKWAIEIDLEKRFPEWKDISAMFSGSTEEESASIDNR
jgi:hypothetical protein